MGKNVPLGKAAPAAKEVAVDEPKSVEERLAAMQYQIDQLAAAIDASARSKLKRQPAAPGVNLNKDGIEMGMSLLGYSRRGGVHFLTVAPDGYYLGAQRHNSLSAAAEAASGVRRSGWTYWHYPDGRNVKETVGK
jgi:hypothetical protein